MLICEIIFSLDSKWSNKVILPTPDNSLFCFIVVHGYLGNNGNPTLRSLVDFDYVE